MISTHFREPHHPSEREEAKKVFDARLQAALAQANRQLNKSNWSCMNLSEMVHSAMAPFGDRTMIDGVGVMVDAQHAQSFSLALHELATNAAKYGALSNERGRVKVFWTITPHGKDNRLKFKWKETGGPPVVAPTGHGFGTSLLRATFADVRIDYLIEGLTCEIDLVLGRARLGASSNPQFRRNLASDGLRPGCCVASRPSDASRRFAIAHTPPSNEPSEA
jgi:two-component sensor histidine kinase